MIKQHYFFTLVQARKSDFCQILLTHIIVNKSVFG